MVERSFYALNRCPDLEDPGHFVEVANTYQFISLGQSAGEMQSLTRSVGSKLNLSRSSVAEKLCSPE